MPGDPNRIVKVFRPESAVSSLEAIESFKDIPLINDHEMLSGFDGDDENTAPEEYGVDGVMTGNVYYEAPWMRGDLKVFSRSMQQALRKGKKCLSLGYDCDFEEAPGTWQGQAYELVQVNMRGNHIALVDDGRVPGARVLDGRCFDHMSFTFKPSDEDDTMPKGIKAMDKAARDSAVDDLRKLIPALTSALEKFLAEEAQEPQHEGGEQPAADPAADPAAEPEEGTPEAIAQPEQDVDPAADPAAEPAADPAAEPAAEGNSLEELIGAARDLLARLEAAAGGEQPQPESEAPAQDEVEANEVKDTVEGLQAQDPVEGAQVATDEDPMAAAVDNEEPAVPAQKAQDAALRHFYADAAAKDSLYKRVSPLVGAFDHRAMDARAVSVYGVKKLGIKCADGQEMVVLDAYLSGIEMANKAAKTAPQKRAQDAAPKCDELEDYLKGSI